MTRNQLLNIFETHRSQWLRSPPGLASVAELRHDVLDRGKDQSSRILSDDGGLRIALQALGSGVSLPIHDHPGARGLITVQEGLLHVQSFDILENHAGGRTALLIRRGKRTIGVNGYDWIGKNRHNLHSLESDANFTLVFSIRQYTPTSMGRRAYAFVFDDRQDESTGIAITKPL